MTSAIATAIIASPIGLIHLWGDERALHGVRIEMNGNAPEHAPKSGAVALAAQEMKHYFAGKATEFTVPLAALRSPRGAVLRDAIRSVNFGETVTYGALAKRCSSGARAVGSACRTNPFPIIVPCHRVVSADGNNAYYSGGEGAPTKAWLIAHEARYTKGK